MRTFEDSLNRDIERHLDSLEWHAGNKCSECGKLLDEDEDWYNEYEGLCFDCADKLFEDNDEKEY